MDEVPFISQNDELIKFLLTSKKQGRIELVLVTKNALDVVSNGSDLDFANIIMFQHSTPTAVDDISRACLVHSNIIILFLELVMYRIYCFP